MSYGLRDHLRFHVMFNDNTTKHMLYITVLVNGHTFIADWGYRKVMKSEHGI